MAPEVVHDATLEYNYYDSAHPGYVLPQLKRFVSLRAQHPRCMHFYVGQTNDPRRRLGEHQRKWLNQDLSTWTNMTVIYAHWSSGFVSEVETALIEHARSVENPKWADTGFNRQLHERPENYYVYVLVDENRQGVEERTRPDTRMLERQKLQTRSRDLRNAYLVEAFEEAIRDTVDGRPARYIYVGFTCNHGSRYAAHRASAIDKYGGTNWDRMIVLYRTGSLNSALEAESTLFAHALAQYPRNLLTSNVRTLDDGRLPESYVYLLEERVPPDAGFRS